MTRLDTPTHTVMVPLLTGSLFRPDLYHFFTSLDSTNQRASLLAQEGAAEGTVVVADHQTHGRGRLGRNWSSPSGLNLYFSVVLRPTIPPHAAAQLTLLAGLALAQTVAAAGAVEVEIKWPNDLLLRGRKLAGVLTEMRTDVHGIQYVIVGVGMNIHGNATAFPVELRHKVVALAEVVRYELRRSLLLASTLAHLAIWYERFLQEGFGALRQEWLTFSRVCGRQVQVNQALSSHTDGTVTIPSKRTDSFSGQALSLDMEGFLLVQRPDGEVVRVVAGDVTILGGD